MYIEKYGKVKALLKIYKKLHTVGTCTVHYAGTLICVCVHCTIH
jgi:hypothetical protein